MSLSRNERSENIELALKLMMEELGEHGINEWSFEIDKSPYENIYPTTWQYLEDQYFIERRNRMGSRRCGLTGYGWLEGLRITGTLETPGIKKKVGKVMAELKRSVEGRQDEALVDANGIATGAGVPYGFLYNIIDSHYIENIIQRKGAAWHPQAPRQLIVIPVDFGLEIL
jgi:hypothetical protein